MDPEGRKYPQREEIDFCLNQTFTNDEQSDDILRGFGFEIPSVWTAVGNVCSTGQIDRKKGREKSRKEHEKDRESEKEQGRDEEGEWKNTAPITVKFSVWP